MNHTRDFVLSTTEPAFQLTAAAPAQRERIIRVEATLFKVTGATVYIDASNCCFHFVLHTLSDDYLGDVNKNNVFTKNPAAAPTMASMTRARNRFVMLPHGDHSVDKVIRLINAGIAKHTQFLRFSYAHGHFVQMLYKHPSMNVDLYRKAFQFSLQNTDPTLSGSPVVSTAFPFEILEGRRTITLTQTTGLLNGDSVSIGFLSAAADANGYSRSDVSTSFPFIVRLGSQLFEVIAIASDTTLRTRNAAKHDIKGALFSQSPLDLIGDKIRLPSYSETVDATVRTFGSAYGSIMPGLGFPDMRFHDLNLVGHITTDQYKRAYLGASDFDHVSFATEYEAKGRFSHTVREAVISGESIKFTANPGGAIELFRESPLGNSSTADRITAIRVSGTAIPQTSTYASLDESAYVLRLKSKNALELLNTQYVVQITEGKEGLVNKTEAVSGLALCLRSSLGEHVQLASCAGSFPGMLMFEIVDASGQRINDTIHARIGLRISYERKP